jgi:hypothetical protein
VLPWENADRSGREAAAAGVFNSDFRRRRRTVRTPVGSADHRLDADVMRIHLSAEPWADPFAIRRHFPLDADGKGRKTGHRR